MIVGKLSKGTAQILQDSRCGMRVAMQQSVKQFDRFRIQSIAPD